MTFVGKITIIIINIFTYVFVIMIGLTAIANVFNTISTNINLRKRELSMLKSIGMGDKSFRKMMNFEAVFYSIKSLFYSIIFSIIVSILIYRGLVFSGLEIDYILPYKSLIIGILFVFIIIFLSMKYSIKKIESENIVDNLKLI